MRMRKEWVLVACLLLVAPTYALAAGPQEAGASKHFPDDPNTSVNVASGAAGVLSLKLKLRIGCPQVQTTFNLNGPMAGEDVATLSANELCEAALAAGYTASSESSCNPPDSFPCGPHCADVDPNTCCQADPNQTQTVVFRDYSPGACQNRGFVLTRNVHSDAFDVDPIAEIGAAGVISLLSQSDAGNAVGTDLLPNWIVQVNPNDANGIVHFVVATEGNASACSFDVDAAAYGNDARGLHQMIADEYGNCLLTPPLNCNVLPPGPGRGSGFPELFQSGPYVFCANVKGAGVTELTVGGAENQAIVRETTTGIGGGIPTLSTWGMALLVLTLLLLGTWMLRRRRLGQRT